MKVLHSINRVTSVLGVNRILGRVADGFLPRLEAHAGVIVCWDHWWGTCNDCATNKRWHIVSSAPSSQCDQGWPACQGCNWTVQSINCEGCA